MAESAQPSALAVAPPDVPDHVEPEEQPLQRLQRRLGYRFADPALLRQAMTHRSHALDGAAEPSAPREKSIHNERLEFLGDAVLDLIISSLLFHRHPQAPEGSLSRWRSALVNTRTLSEIARDLELGGCLRMGRGEAMSGGRGKTSILGNALEAVLGAVHLDGGYDAAHAVAQRLYEVRLAQVREDHLQLDFKSMLQERLQGDGRSLPAYEVTSVSGAPHQRLFEVACRVAGLGPGEGRGKSKRVAEQQAARAMMTMLDANEKAPNG